MKKFSPRGGRARERAARTVLDLQEARASRDALAHAGLTHTKTYAARVLDVRRLEGTIATFSAMNPKWAAILAELIEEKPATEGSPFPAAQEPVGRHA